MNFELPSLIDAIIERFLEFCETNPKNRALRVPPLMQIYTDDTSVGTSLRKSFIRNDHPDKDGKVSVYCETTKKKAELFLIQVRKQFKIGESNLVIAVEDDNKKHELLLNDSNNHILVRLEWISIQRGDGHALNILQTTVYGKKYLLEGLETDV